MMILATMPTFNSITGQQDGVTVGLIPIDLMSIKTISEEEETGFATIHYKMSEPLETNTPFTEFLEILDRQGLVENQGLARCIKVSTRLKDYIDKLNKAEKDARNTLQ